ncbi:MAG: hypothetical protein HDR18_00315 [Lachnospiraceae bacterium]|nr:hypothetical protein [Lachnospiraceae bacterium]
MSSQSPGEDILNKEIDYDPISGLIYAMKNKPLLRGLPSVAGHPHEGPEEQHRQSKDNR